MDGLSYRFARKCPSPSTATLRRFQNFVDRFNRQYLNPLSSDVDTSVPTWLLHAPYRATRKRELYELYSGLASDIPEPRARRDVKSFIKDEFYETSKYPRCINSRSDVFKLRVAPIFALIERAVFSLPWFIKHVPVPRRPDVLLSEVHQEGATVIGTDYSCYEACFTKLFMESCELRLYKYMTQNLPDQEWYKIVEDGLTGRNFCRFKNLSFLIDATRMSGEMCTSLGNGYANLMAMLFIAEEKKLQSLKGRVEGDDGIFSFFGDCPTEQDFADLGMLIKISKYESVTTGSFCGILSDPDELINVTNPILAMLKFGWTTKEYANAKPKKLLKLLRAKALSLSYSYPGCPILDSLAKYAVRVTNGVYYKLPNSMSTYEVHEFHRLRSYYNNKVPNVPVGLKTRLLVEKRFKISVTDQFQIEAYLDSLNNLTVLDHPLIMKYCSPVHREYFQKYSFAFRNAKEVDRFPTYMMHYGRGDHYKSLNCYA